ncbi:MAG TPA: hypothetical protein DER15_00455 [Clostridiales bacterium]|nr:hypothetical protein [Clostridiales bacterium]
MRDSERELDKIFLSYNKILARLNKQGCKTKNGKEITHKDLRKAILVMQEKHPKCRWRSNKVRSRKFYILDEGYWWIVEVFFQNELDLIDADIKYFKKRIKLYEDFLKIKPKELFVNNIPYSQVENFFNRKLYTIKRAIRFLENKYSINLRYKKDNRMYVYSKGIELLCKECFKQKYLDILENYKMELTEKYIAAGYPYDNFFHRN